MNSLLQMDRCRIEKVVWCVNGFWKDMIKKWIHHCHHNLLESLIGTDWLRGKKVSLWRAVVMTDTICLKYLTCFQSFMFSTQAIKKLVDRDAWNEGQSSRNSLLVLHIIVCKEMDEGELLLLNPLPEESPAGNCIAQNTHWVTQHYLQRSKV